MCLSCFAALLQPCDPEARGAWLTSHSNLLLKYISKRPVMIAQVTLNWAEMSFLMYCMFMDCSCVPEFLSCFQLYENCLPCMSTSSVSSVYWLWSKLLSANWLFVSFNSPVWNYDKTDTSAFSGPNWGLLEHQCQLCTHCSVTVHHLFLSISLRSN